MKSRGTPWQGLLSRMRVGWLLLVLLACGLRMYGLEQESLSLDEIGQVQVAGGSFWQTVIRSAQHHGNTPLDYVVTHLTLYVGQSEGILRLPPVIWGVLSILLVYLIGRDLFDRSVGHLAAALLTITPLHVYYSREVRFYSLATFLALLNLYLFQRAVKRNTRWSWVLVGMAFSLGLYAHYYFLIIGFIEAIWLYGVVRVTRSYRCSVFKRFLLVFCLSLVLFSPWLFHDMRYAGLCPRVKHPVVLGIALTAPGLLNPGQEWPF